MPSQKNLSSFNMSLQNVTETAQIQYRYQDAGIWVEAIILINARYFIFILLSRYLFL